MRGSISKKNNKWYIVVDIGMVEGKRKQKWFSGYDRKKDAEKDLPEILKRIQDNMFSDPKNMTVNDLLEEWYKTKKLTIRKSTIRSYETIISRIRDDVGTVKLKQLKPMHIQQFYNRLLEKISVKTVKNTHGVLHTALKHAVKMGLIPTNPTEFVDLPKYKKPEISVFTKEQINLFLDYIKDEEYYLSFLLALTTGIRKGELLGLKYEDIDTAENVINIRRARQREGMTELKTEKSRRKVAVPPYVMAEILKNKKEHKTKHSKFFANLYEENDFVCKHNYGVPYHVNYLSKKLHQLCDELNFNKIRFHDLRHSHATLLVSSGVNLKIVQDRLGHSTISTTADVYSHPDVKAQADAIKNIF
ncbi:MAG: site-specific integrase [Clostridia bacterium]|jgi:integrase|nr:site-specific integrase [Clostridia bacterium]